MHIIYLDISSPPLPHNRKNKHANILDDLFWVGFWKGRGSKEKKRAKTEKTKKNMHWRAFSPSPIPK
jgi:hypothetical protein